MLNLRGDRQIDHRPLQAETMIVRPKPNLIGILTSLKGSIAKRIAWRALMVTCAGRPVQSR
ncbi:hypothetical protein J1D76_23380 [Pseudomonas sp. NFX15]